MEAGNVHNFGWKVLSEESIDERADEDNAD
jgi:hypothetical protein